MARLSAVTKEKYGEKSWNRYTSYDFASKDNIAPLVGAEIAKAVSSLPMAFVSHQGRFSLVAVLSLEPGTNMFVAPNGRWLGNYIPSTFRGYPFRLAKAKGKEDLVLCVDEATGLIQDDTEAKPFFDESGNISGQVRDLLDFLNQVEQNRTATDAAVACLADAGVLVEWHLKIKDGNREKPVAGLYRIDASKLNSLADGQFLQLRNAQALPVAYGQLLSMGNIRVFEKLAKIKEQISQIPVKARQNTPVLGDDDIISFG